MSYRKYLLNLVGVLWTSFVGTGVVGASVVNVDFQYVNPPGGIPYSTVPVYSGLGAYTSDTGTYWNAYLDNNSTYVSNSTLITNLLASDGFTATSVGFSLGAHWPGSAQAPFGSAYDSLLCDYAYMDTTFLPPDYTKTSSFTISGLTAGQSYDLYLYGTAGSQGQGAIFTISGVSQRTTGGNDTTFVEGINYVVFRDLIPNRSNEIVGTWTANPDTAYPQWGPFNAFQLIGRISSPGSDGTVPELASLAIWSVLGLVGVGVVWYHKRHC